LAMRLMSEVIDAVGWLVNNGRKCNRNCCRLMIDKVVMRMRLSRNRSSLSRSVRDYIQQLSFLHRLRDGCPLRCGEAGTGRRCLIGGGSREATGGTGLPHSTGTGEKGRHRSRMRVDSGRLASHG
jgi:hypothetical protein